jgi:hypothetical protein
MLSALTEFVAQRTICGALLLHGALAVRLCIARVSSNVFVGHISFASRGGMHNNITTQLLDQEVKQLAFGILCSTNHLCTGACS